MIPNLQPKAGGVPRKGPAKVFVIDDHPLMREGFARVIGLEEDLELVGESGRGRGAAEQVERTAPDVLILDLSLRDASGLELIKDFRARGFEKPILVVSMHDEGLYAERVLRAGANGYLMKEEASERLIEGIRAVLDDEVFLSEKMNRLLLKRFTAGGGASGRDGMARLTDREVEVFELIGRGRPPRQIADQLGISPRTVDAHRTHIKEKLGFESGADLVRHAVRWLETEADGTS